MSDKFLPLLVGAALLYTLTASASTKRTIPQIQREPIEDVEAGGSRGCSTEIASTSLILLTPRNQTQLTVSKRPTFVWYVSKASVTVRFTLIKPETPGFIYRQSVQLNQPGFVALRLPPDTELVENQEYRWTVTVVCNELKPSSNRSIWAWFKPIATPPELKEKLSTATSGSEHTQIYAEAGLWHDAYGVWYDTLSKNNAAPNSEDTTLTENFQRLLEQIGIPETIREKLRQNPQLTIIQ